MRTRDVTIPLGLWICAAIGAHFLFGTGGLVVAKVHDDRSELRRLSLEANSLAKHAEETLEVSLVDGSEETLPSPPREAPPPKRSEPPPTPPSPTAAPVEEKRAIVVEKKPADKKPLVLPEDPLKDRRIAVRQHVRPDQEDNPTAKFIADEANHVASETVATQTSHDRDDERPTPGRSHTGGDTHPGDSEKTRIAERDAHPGVRDRAPGERGLDFDVLHEPKIPKPAPAPTAAAASAAPAQAPPGSSAASNGEAKPSPPQAAVERPASGVAPPAPAVESTPDGSWSFSPARQGTPSEATPQPTPRLVGQNVPGGRLWSLPGLGRSGPPGALNTNLSQGQIAAIVGVDSLRKLRENDGERRRTEHRGSWAGSSFDRWRSAIENYVSDVKAGNQTALNTAQVPFASYLNGMHNKIHPIFADSFLGSLDGLPPDHPMNNQHLVTRLEIVLTKEGRLKRMGVVRTSGITAFDIAALDAVDRAQPFGVAPKAIVSGDGNVYLHWEFHRDEVYACSTMGARPFILNIAPKNEEPPASPPAGPGKDRGIPPNPNDAREGALPPADLRRGGGTHATILGRRSA
jgi:TonB family protein